MSLKISKKKLCTFETLNIPSVSRRLENSLSLKNRRGIKGSKFWEGGIRQLGWAGMGSAGISPGSPGAAVAQGSAVPAPERREMELLAQARAGMRGQDAVVGAGIWDGDVGAGIWDGDAAGEQGCR